METGGWRKTYFTYLLIAGCMFAINLSLGIFLYAAAAYTVSRTENKLIRNFHLALNGTPAILALLSLSGLLSFVSMLGIPVGLMWRALVVPWGSALPAGLIPDDWSFVRYVYWFIWMLGVAGSTLWFFLIRADQGVDDTDMLA